MTTRAAGGVHFITALSSQMDIASTATHYNTPQHAATHCDTLQRTATHRAAARDDDAHSRWEVPFYGV